MAVVGFRRVPATADLFLDKGLQAVRRWLQEGIEQGLAHQRALVSAGGVRFGAEAATRVSPPLERTADPERLAAAGE